MRGFEKIGFGGWGGTFVVCDARRRPVGEDCTIEVSISVMSDYP